MPPVVMTIAQSTIMMPVLECTDTVHAAPSTLKSLDAIYHSSLCFDVGMISEFIIASYQNVEWSSLCSLDKCNNLQEVLLQDQLVSVAQGFSLNVNIAVVLALIHIQTLL